MRDKLPNRWRKITVAVSGGSVVLLGIIALPAPGPGWLIIFAGLAILRKEFHFAGRLLDYGQEKYRV